MKLSYLHKILLYENGKRFIFLVETNEIHL